VTDDFITSGGHSLLLMRFVQTINVKHELELDAAFVLRHSTVRQLASAVDELIQAKAMVLRNVAAAGGGDFIEL
jgi:polysaccharide pyruvyl transferase WcaK-like protein